jgi:glutamine amidotransferase
VIALVDYGAGNLTSVRKALAAIEARVWTPRSPDEIAEADGVIVPGVGHFQSTSALTEDWRRAILASLARGIPLLGICVGLQWLFEGSAEAPGVAGLGCLAGTCTHLGPRTALKVPHVGWNTLTLAKPTQLFDGVADGAYVYFTHSYAAPIVPETAATTSYGRTFSAAVETALVSGVQFHPEKSGTTGLTVLRNWIGSTRRAG